MDGKRNRVKIGIGQYTWLSADQRASVLSLSKLPQTRTTMRDIALDVVSIKLLLLQKSIQIDTPIPMMLCFDLLIFVWFPLPVQTP